MTLTNAVAFVTGGSSGLGAHICTMLAAEGANIAVGYMSGDKRAEDTKRAVEVLGRRACIVRINLADHNSIAAAVEHVRSEMGGLDILVNNAAMAMGGHAIPLGDLQAFTPEIWDEMMSVNVRGPFLVTRAAAPDLQASKWGQIVNIGSTLAHGDWYADRPYAVSKSAIIPLTRFLAAALAPDVRVNCVSPGLMVETALGRGGSERLYEGWRDRAALGVTTSVEDVAGQVVYFCKTTTITGQSIVVDGGINFH